MSELKIDFFGIGAARCSTSWLAQCLNEHPNISMARGKEPTFFGKKLGPFSVDDNEKFLCSWEWYQSLFKGAATDDKLGEFSTNYLPNVDSAPKLIKKYFPDARFIVSLREPVSKMYSQFWFEKNHRPSCLLPESFEEAAKKKELQFLSMYYEQLEKWFEYFTLDKFCIVFDFEINKDPEAVINSLYEFIGVNCDFTPPSLLKKINSSSELNIPGKFLFKLFDKFRNKNLSILAYNLQFPWVKKIFRKRADHPLITHDIENYLNKIFKNDIEKLERLLNRNLSKWKHNSG